MLDTEAYALKSAANALRVIALLGSHRTVTVTDVSLELEVGKSTAHRLLSTLVSEGFALRDPVNRRYHPGRALVEVGLTALEDIKLRSGMERPLATLAAEIHESAKLLVLDGPYVRTVRSADGNPSGRTGESIGPLLPANATAAGKVLLSGESLESLKIRFKGKLPARTSTTITDWDAMMDELRLVRERGWSWNDSEATEGLRGLAIPVVEEGGRVISALSVVAPSERMGPEDQMRILRHMFAAVFGLNRIPDADL